MSKTNYEGCDKCKHFEKKSNELPCRKCKHNYPEMYEPAEEEESE
jgi:hypothetical protein